MKLAEARMLRGWDQADLAEQAGVQRSLISLIETGKRRTFEATTMKRIADALEKKISDVDEFVEAIRLRADNPRTRKKEYLLSMLNQQEALSTEARAAIPAPVSF